MDAASQILCCLNGHWNIKAAYWIQWLLVTSIYSNSSCTTFLEAGLTNTGETPTTHFSLEHTFKNFTVFFKSVQSFHVTLVCFSNKISLIWWKYLKRSNSVHFYDHLWLQFLTMQIGNRREMYLFELQILITYHCNSVTMWK